MSVDVILRALAVTGRSPGWLVVVSKWLLGCPTGCAADPELSSGGISVSVKGSVLGQELGYILHDAIPELLSAEAIELVLNLGETHLDAPGFVLGGLGSGGGRGVLSVKIL